MAGLARDSAAAKQIFEIWRIRVGGRLDVLCDWNAARHAAHCFVSTMWNNGRWMEFVVRDRGERGKSSRSGSGYFGSYL